MVERNLATFEAAVAAKEPDLAHYDFYAAVGDLRDFQAICMPARIAADMSVAIATKRFDAFPVQPAAPTKSTDTTTKATAGGGDAATKNPAIVNFDGMVAADGTSPPVSARAKIVLRPSDN